VFSISLYVHEKLIEAQNQFGAWGGIKPVWSIAKVTWGRKTKRPDIVQPLLGFHKNAF
jgi:hypothetical protein